MELVSLTPEGRVLLTLHHGQHLYSELKFETGLSDRWISKKLGELVDDGLIKKVGRWYGLDGLLSVSGYELNLYLRTQAMRITNELAEEDSVDAVILFGSLARGVAHEYSDIDLIIVVDGLEGKQKVRGMIPGLESRYHFTIEPLVFSFRDFRDNLESQSGGIIYGVAEGYRVLYDSAGEVSDILEKRVEEIKGSHEYIEDVRIWVKTR